MLALFEIEDLTYLYPGGARPALRSINLAVDEGEFLLVVGASGSGKSSLARLLAGLLPHFYGGILRGRALFKGKEIWEYDPRSLATQVGIVFQDPERQLVMASVEAELAFGLENLGLSQEEMRRRLAEVAGPLGLSSLLAEFTARLSGGQKQKVALAAVLAMQPEVLVLDEPTSQLDPRAAEEFFHIVERLNRELGYTVVLIEQRLERCFQFADRVVVLEEGEVVREGTPAEVARWGAREGLPFVPPVPRLFALLGSREVPLTVKEGREKLRSLKNRLETPKKPSVPEGPKGNCGDRPVLAEARDLWFTYPDGR